MQASIMCTINVDGSTIWGLKVTLHQNKQHKEPAVQPVFQPNIINPAIYSLQIKVEITTSTVMKGISADNRFDRVDTFNGCKCLFFSFLLSTSIHTVQKQMS